MENKGVKTQSPEEEMIFSLQDFLKKCLSHWKLFLISVILFCCVGAWYGLRQEPVYLRKMELLIKDKDSGKGMDIGGAFSSMGFGSSKAKVNNELITLKSPAVMYDVVKELGLDVSYSTPARFYARTLYGTNLPYLVQFKDLDEQDGAGFKITQGKSGELILDKFYRYTPEGRVDYPDKINVKPSFNDIKTPLGNIVLSPNGRYIPSSSKKGYSGTPIAVSRNGMQSTVEAYSSEVYGDRVDKDADVIELIIKDHSIERAVDILNTILAVYNKNWVEDKNKISSATSRFIDERLQTIQEELGVVDSDISKFKSEHLVPDVEEAARLQMKQSAEMSTKMLETTNQMAMASYLRDYLMNPSNENSVIPVNTGIGSAVLESQITSYNTILLNRNNVLSNSSESNPIVRDYNVQLAGLRRSISEAVDAQISALKTSLRNMQGEQGAVDNKLASGPTQAKYLLSIERQQKVKQELYLYLLQKREENELSQKFVADNVRVITPPMGSLRQVSPKKKMIVMVMFLLGLIFPAVWVYLRSVMDNKVRTRKDLDTLTVPFAGEIPYAGKRPLRERFSWLIPAKKKSAKDMEKVIKVVSAGSRDVVSESFRIMRGNLDFMNRRKGESSVILITSFNPGSGKSFISYNLAVSFALKGKRVLLVDGDLRHGSVSQFVNMPSKGLTNYLTGNIDSWQQFVVANREQDNMFIMPIGHRPPNPAELIESGRMGEFIEEARKEFDYILIDCPPTDVVIDTRLMEQYADSTLFVVRAGLLEKKQLTDIDSVYNRKEFKNMCIVLNATTDGAQNKSYGSYAYYSND